MGRRGSRVLTRTPRSCRSDPRDVLTGHGARPSLGPPASPLPARRLVGRCTQQPTPSAKSARRVEDAGGRRRAGLCFYFSKALDFTAKFPGRRLDSGVGASHRRSFPSPPPRPQEPSEREPPAGLGGQLGPPGQGPRRPQCRAALPAPSPGSAGVLIPGAKLADGRPARRHPLPPEELLIPSIQL